MIHHGDCLEVMPTLPAESVDSIVTDPPYGLSFMGKNWDHGIPGESFWREALRIAKPGTHLLAFGGTRTFHRLTCAIEDAGWEIRDCVMWVYGSGFPKSHDVSKAIDREAGAERICTRPGMVKRDGYGEDWDTGSSESRPRYDAPATPAAQQWQGWGTALKPAWEPIIVARKPLAGTVAQNVQRYGTGAVNVDGCRIGNETVKITPSGTPGANSYRLIGGDGRNVENAIAYAEQSKKRPIKYVEGRWPANLIHDGSDEVVGLFPDSKGTASGGKPERNSKNSEAYWGEGGGGFKGGRSTVAHADSGSAARFFYCAKASKSDRDEGCEGIEFRACGSDSGRWPANLIHDGSDEVVGLFPETRPAKAAARGGTNPNPMDWGNSRSDGHIVKGHDDNGGSAARFFYCAKASKSDRDEGCEGIEFRACGLMEDDNYDIKTGSGNSRNTQRRNHHPTVKPTALMRYLCRLVTQPGGIVFDPFCGSGSTGKAATLEGLQFIGIEREAEYVEIAKARIAHARGEMPLKEAVQ